HRLYAQACTKGPASEDFTQQSVLRESLVTMIARSFTRQVRSGSSASSHRMTVLTPAVKPKEEDETEEP
ncbi:MAG: hypothetical protein ACREXR_14965, partial [Gammaproteobacteria bacterium]